MLFKRVIASHILGDHYISIWLKPLWEHDEAQENVGIENRQNDDEQIEGQS